MNLIYIATAENGENKNSRDRIRHYCEYLRFEGVPLCGNLVFSCMNEYDRTGWYREHMGMELIDCCKAMYVFTDEVTELLIKEIRHAQKKGIPVHFHEASAREVDADALIINRKIGPGYRKIIAEANGDKCGSCPYMPCAEEKKELETAGVPDEKDSDKKEGSLFHKVFGSR